MESDDLDTIDPPGNEVEFAGRKITIKPLTVGKLPAFARTIRPIAGAIDRLGSITPVEIVGLIADHGETIIKAISIASGIDEQELQDADPVTLMTLINPIVKANSDFFRLRLLLAGKNRSAAASHGAGLTP